MNHKTLIPEIKTIKDLQTLIVLEKIDWSFYGQVNVKESGSLRLFNYSQQCSLKPPQEWNAFEIMSRGLILDSSNGEIVARPMDKFFNWFQGGLKSSGYIVTIMEKLDGSFGILYRDPSRKNKNKDIALGEYDPSAYKIATRGSFDSEQAIWATEWIHKYGIWQDMQKLGDEYTFLFEIIYPENKIVVDYGKRTELVLLAVRNRFTGDYLPFFGNEDYSVYGFADKLGVDTPKVYDFNSVEDIIIAAGAAKEADTEGWVVEFDDGQRFKFKTDRYLELHKIVTRLSFKNILEAMKNNRLNDIYNIVPDEFVDMIQAWDNDITEQYNQILSDILEAYTKIAESIPGLFTILPEKIGRKAFATAVHTHSKNLAPYLFAMFDGEDITDMIWSRHMFLDRTSYKNDSEE